MLLGWVRLRWPTREAALAAPRRTAVPPSRPAIQASDVAARLSSCSRATVTCSIRLPRRDQLVKGPGVRRPAHRLAQRLVAEHLRELGKDLQVLLGRLDRKSTRLNSSHRCISYAVFCLKKKKQTNINRTNKIC